MAADPYPRDLIGYGQDPPVVRWPGGARIAVNFVLNYEEGGERSVLHGDDGCETFISEIIGSESRPERHLTMESIYEYGTRVGVWRILDLFADRQLPLTVFAVGMAVERTPEPIRRALAEGHEICSHGYRWIDYAGVPESEERADIARAVAAIEKVTGERPAGWYTGRTSVNTRRLVAETGGFLYDADDYSDDLPFWSRMETGPHLIVPYTLDANDMRFAAPQGFNTADHFYTYLRDSFDVLYAEGARTPRMLSVGLHCRISGRPGRIAGLARFLDYVREHEDVWCCRRVEIARHWREHYPCPRGAEEWRQVT